MSHHFTKLSDPSLSQIPPSSPAEVAWDITLADTYVLLCDWHGRVVWKSGVGDRVAIGEEIWKRVAGSSVDSLRSALASVVTLQEKCIIQVESDRGDHFRFRMWPLNDPEIAVCILALRIPSEISLLTNREQACLQCLARGMPTRDIAEDLGIGLTTVHTHLRRSREKLGVANAEALIAFAARHFFAPSPPVPESPTRRKRSV